MRKTNMRGFTLIEVLVAVSVLGIMSALAATNFRAQIPAFRARGAALLVAGDLNQTRLRAVKEGRLFQFNSIGGTSYQILRADDLGVFQVEKEVDISAEFPHAVFGHSGITTDPYGNAITAATPGTPIIFHSDGTVQNPAGIFIEVPSPEGQKQQGVTVTGAGRIRVWGFHGTDWS